MATLKKSKKPILIVLEGPDMCGKTSHVESVSNMLKSKGYKVDTFKYPIYNGDYGEEIEYFLSSFDISKNNMEENIKLVADKDYFDFCNKIFSEDKLLKLAKKNDFVIVDRFVLSQFVYTAAWLCLLNSYKHNVSLKFKWSINKYKNQLDFVLKRSFAHFKDVLDTFNKSFEIKTILFKKSKFINHIALNERCQEELSKYDISENYQVFVSRLFEYVSSIQSYSESNVNVVLEDKPDQCLPIKNNSIVSTNTDVFHNVRNSIDISEIVDTDAIFEKEIQKYINNLDADGIAKYCVSCENLRANFESEDKYIEHFVDIEDITVGTYETVDEQICKYVETIKEFNND